MTATRQDSDAPRLSNVSGEFIQLNLTNNQALHLWGILIGYSYNTRRELIARKVFKSDGTVNRHRKHFSEVTQEQMDNIVLSDLIYQHLEPMLDFSALEALPNNNGSDLAKGHDATSSNQSKGGRNANT